MKNTTNIVALLCVAAAAAAHAGEKIETESLNGIDVNGYGIFKLVAKPECKLMVQRTDKEFVSRHLVCGEVGVNSTYKEVNLHAPVKDVKPGDKVVFEGSA